MVARNWTAPIPCSCVMALLLIPRLDVIGAGGDHGRIRLYNARISEVFRLARQRSPSFDDLVVTLEQLDRIVYIQEGRCRHGEARSCLQIMPTPGAGNLVIRLDPRQSIVAVVEQLAHELYHAAEIARSPEVRDTASARELFGRIGERSCIADSDDCWETRAAVAFERVVRQQFTAWH
jgi:hypothetical protein